METVKKFEREAFVQLTGNMRAAQNYLDSVSLRGADLSNLNLSRLNFSDAYMRGANLSGSDLTDTDFTEADLTDAIMIGAELCGACMDGVICTRALMKNANFEQAFLTKSDLSGAVLEGATFYYADLSESDLTGADLSFANLDGADLQGANLKGAILINARLHGTNLSGTKGLLDACLYMDQNFERTYDGFIVYKSFGECYECPDYWDIKPGSIIEEAVDPDRTCEVGCGINVGTKDYVRIHATKPAYKLLIIYEWLINVVVPFNTDGKIRCGKAMILGKADL